MTSEIINKDDYNLLVEWSDKKIGFGQLTMKWDNEKGVYILDSEHMGVNTILKIIKAL